MSFTSPIVDLLSDFRAGKIVILVDDEKRENEGDLVVAADLATPESVAFMASLGCGLICLGVSESEAQRLGLDLMVPPQGFRQYNTTAFTTTIDARHGITTGISAADRAYTIRLAANPNSSSADFVRPGHVLPLMARTGGVFVRPGHTEASTDLSKLCGFSGMAVICEILCDGMHLARMPDLKEFSERYDLKIGRIDQLIHYRFMTENLLRLVFDYNQPDGRRFLGFDFPTRHHERYYALASKSFNPSEKVYVRVYDHAFLPSFLLSNQSVDEKLNALTLFITIDESTVDPALLDPAEKELDDYFFSFNEPHIGCGVIYQLLSMLKIKDVEFINSYHNLLQSYDL